MLIHRGRGEDVVVTMSHAELVRILIVLDAAERNYRGQPHEIPQRAAQAMIEKISAMREQLEKVQ